MKFRNLRYLNLLVVIIVMMILSPLVSRSPYLRMANNIVLILVLLSVVNTVKKQRAAFVVGLILGIPWLLAAWIHLINPGVVPPAILAATSLVFDGYIIIVLLRHIIRIKRVTADILFGAFSVYILLGVFYTSVYYFIEALTSTPMFINAGTGGPVDPTEIFYFSFVTLTTLGYGDIQPVGDASRIFSIIEAMTGVLYTGALIGRLIGLYVAQYGGSGAAAEAASKAAEAAAAAAGATVAQDTAGAAAAAEVASKAAADAAEAAEAARSDNSSEDEEDDDADDRP